MSRCNSMISDDSRANSFQDRFKGKISQMPKKGIEEVIKKKSPHVDKTLPSITRSFVDVERSYTYGNQMMNYEIPSFRDNKIPDSLMSGPNTPSSLQEGRYVQVASIMGNGRIPSPIYSHETTCKPHNMYVVNAQKPLMYGPNFEQNDIQNSRGYNEELNNMKNNTPKVQNQMLPNILVKTQKNKRKTEREKIMDETNKNVIISTMIETPQNKKTNIKNKNPREALYKVENIKALNPTYYKQQNFKEMADSLNQAKNNSGDMMNDKIQTYHSPEVQHHNNEYVYNNYPPMKKVQVVQPDSNQHQSYNYNRNNIYREQFVQNSTNRNYIPTENIYSVSPERKYHSKSPDINRIRANNILNINKNSGMYASYDDRQGNKIENQTYITNSPRKKINALRSPEKKYRVGGIVHNSISVDKNVHNSVSIERNPVRQSRGNLSKSFDVNEYKFMKGPNRNINNNSIIYNDINYANSRMKTNDSTQLDTNSRNNSNQKKYGVNYPNRMKGKPKVDFGTVGKTSMR